MPLTSACAPAVAAADAALPWSAMSYPQPTQAKRREEDFDINDLLGRGTFVSVYSAVERKTGLPFAIKVVDRYRCGKLKKTNDMYMEKHCLSRTNHPNIIKMKAWFSDTANVWVVMEECLGGELWDVVKTVGCPKNFAHHYLTQLLNACGYLRQARIVHRDLKAENIMLTVTGVLKVIDFGTAKDLENPHIKGSGNASRAKVFEDYVGTPQFMPVEVIENKCTDFKSDTWSLGCTIFQVIAGVPAFHHRSEYLVFTRIMDMDLQFPPGFDEQAEDLVRKMVVKEREKRLGGDDLGDVRGHPYFEGAVFEGAHKRPLPMRSLADCCLQTLGRDLKKFKDQLSNWKDQAKLTPGVSAQIERLKVVEKWRDDATPGEETC